MNAFTFWAGNYASAEEPGVLEYAFAPGTGFQLLRCISGLRNPSFVLENPAKGILYTVEELSEGQVCAWNVRGSQPVLLSRLSTGGADPCHLALSDDGRWLYAANYTSGSVACFALDANGNLLRRTDLRQHEGKGPNPLRQEAPHAHCVFPVNEELLVCDLGLDAIFTYRNENGSLREVHRLRLTPGCGPRHLAAHPKLGGMLYCITELAGTVVPLRLEADGSLTALPAMALLKEPMRPEWTGAAIHPLPDGSGLLLSLRGCDRIAFLPLGADGAPGAPRCFPTVPVPRDFLLKDETLLVGSQQDGTLQAYSFAPEQGMIPLSWKTRMSSPVCLQIRQDGKMLS